jgi:hypothetical protein
MLPVVKHLSPASGEGATAATVGRRLYASLLLPAPPATGTSTDEEAASAVEGCKPP